MRTTSKPHASTSEPLRVSEVGWGRLLVVTFHLGVEARLEPSVRLVGHGVVVGAHLRQVVGDGPDETTMTFRVASPGR